MVRFRIAEAPARGEFLVEAFVPSEGNDAALIAVFNSEGAASKFASFMNDVSDHIGEVVRYTRAMQEPDLDG